MSPTFHHLIQSELHVLPCPVCDKFGHKAMDCPELCPLCIKTRDYNHIMAGPQWKGHPDYVITEEDLPNFDDLTTIDHTHFALILLKSLGKDIEKKKGIELEKLRSKTINRSLHEFLVKAKNLKTPKFDNVARIPTPDIWEITVVNEEWFKRRRKPKKGYHEWKF
jgi:hypothetical protein